MPLDIFIPYWGDPARLRATVESVLGQDDDSWTLTIVDDAYPGDAARRIVEGCNDSRVAYVRNEANLGINRNFQRCAELATHDLIVFLGCDDLLLPNYVRSITQAVARNPGAAIIQPGVEVIGADGRQVDTLVDRVKRWLRPSGDSDVVLSGERLAASLLRGNWLYWPSLALDRRMVQRRGFRPEFPIILDLALVIDMVADGATLVATPETCFQYRRHAESLSSATVDDGSRFRDDRRYYALATAQMESLGWTRARRAARVRLLSRAHALSLVPAALRGRDRASLRHALAHALGR